MKTKINIGSGGRPRSTKKNDWVDLDIRKRIKRSKDNKFYKPDIVADCRKIPIESNTYELVYVNNVLEHFSKNERMDCLKEWYRITKPKGRVLISVPDMELLAKQILKPLNQKNLYQVINFIYGEQNYSENIHKWGYTKSTIERDLTNVGYKDILFRNPKNYDYELVVEAIK